MSSTEFDWQPLTALMPLVYAIKGMLEVAYSDLHDWMAIQDRSLALSPLILQRMLDRQCQQRSQIGIYQAQCARWRQEACLPYQQKTLNELEGYLANLDTCNRQLLKLLAGFEAESGLAAYLSQKEQTAQAIRG